MEYSPFNKLKMMNGIIIGAFYFLFYIAFCMVHHNTFAN